jgi:group I intron endonuclease
MDTPPPERIHHIYKIVNRVNGKLYVGQTIDPCGRWRQHRSCRTTNMAITRAMIKHGVENFVFEIIDFATNQKEVDALEMAWIERLNSLVTGHGYNLQAGGNSSPKTNDFKEKISAANSRRVWTKESRAKRAEANSNRIVSQATRQKMSASQSAAKGRRSNPFTRQELDAILLDERSHREVALSFDCATRTVRKIKQEGFRTRTAQENRQRMAVNMTGVSRKFSKQELADIRSDDRKIADIARAYKCKGDTISKIKDGTVSIGNDARNY